MSGFLWVQLKRLRANRRPLEEVRSGNLSKHHPLPLSVSFCVGDRRFQIEKWIMELPMVFIAKENLFRLF